MNGTGGTELLQTGTLTARNNVTAGGGWEMQFQLTCEQTAANTTTPTIEVDGTTSMMNLSTGGRGGTDGSTALTAQMATGDGGYQDMETDVLNTIGIGVQSSASNAGNEVQLRQFTVQRLGPATN
jgi:hypothetical protein